jgi:hypothetical protein
MQFSLTSNNNNRRNVYESFVFSFPKKTFSSSSCFGKMENKSFVSKVGKKSFSAFVSHVTILYDGFL